MSRIILFIIVAGMVLAYGYRLEQIAPANQPFSPAQPLEPEEHQQQTENEASPLQPTEFAAAGYCGAKIPPGFRRPTLGPILNKDASPMGRTARRLYNDGESETLLDHLTRWQESKATSPYPSIWRALLHLENQMPASALPYLSEAMNLTEDKPVIALILGNILSHTSELPRAIEALSIYAAAYPQDRPQQQKLARLKTQYEIQARYKQSDYRGVELLYPPESSHLEWADILDQIDTKLDEAAEFTGTIRRQTLTVIAFEGKAELLASTCVPSWTGGVYDGSIKLVMHNPEQLPNAVTLAHETLHAQLSFSSPGEIPAWFSEGMAQAFAKEETRAQSSWRKMVEHQTYIPFTSLGDSFLEFEGSDDARLAYHQGLAMVLWLYNTAGPEGLHEAVRALELPKDRQKRLLEIFLTENDSGDFLEFVATLIH
ncbi:MAG: hypothetical protein HOI23_13345 [Deltaproteobacteria bacterium]|nr:hypothetical protein [Deltaproteobacteria bacterium]MBT6434899.1 hypothetical protein [Deltaproteobacteria bacterium]